MRKVSSGGRHIGGSGFRGVSRGRSSGNHFRSVGSSTKYRNNYKVRNRSNYGYHRYSRMYGSSILPFWARIVFFLILMGLLYFGIS